MSPYLIGGVQPDRPNDETVAVGFAPLGRDIPGPVAYAEGGGLLERYDNPPIIFKVDFQL